MKTIYLTILFLLLSMTLTGCADGGQVVLSTDSGNDTVSEADEVYAESGKEDKADD